MPVQLASVSKGRRCLQHPVPPAITESLNDAHENQLKVFNFGFVCMKNTHKI